MKTKRYIVTMFGAYGERRRWETDAKNIREAAAKFHQTKDREWMTAMIRVESNGAGKPTREHDVDSFSRHYYEEN